MTLHLHAPATVWERRVSTCPVCHHHGRIVGMVQLWYGTTWTCCTCGDSWADGELLPRPFQRGWRKKAIARARARWQLALPPHAVKAWITEQLEDW